MAQGRKELLKVSSFRNDFLVSSIFPQKRTKTSRPEALYLVLMSNNFFVRFLGKLRISESPFEINWPLGEGLNILVKCVEESLNVTCFVLKIKLDTKHYVKRTIHMCTTCGTANVSSKVGLAIREDAKWTLSDFKINGHTLSS